MISILIVEDDVSFSRVLERFLKRNNYNVHVSHSLEKALNKLEQNNYNIVFTDLRFPNGSGLDLLKIVQERALQLPVVVMTSYAEVPTAVKAMKLGAFDYISKPFNQENVLTVINNVLDSNKTKKVSKQVQQQNIQKPTNTREDNYIVGISTASKKLNEYINLVAPTDLSVLITGESGSGKEVVAQAIHFQSNRSNKPFIAVDCGAIPKEIAASEFFGHVKGSFTGAFSDKIGHFEAANGGTLFLDEVGNLSYENQIKLLRALQERKIKRIGSNKEIDVDVRLITATNEDLQKAVEQGKFREDLYHRLNEFSVRTPSLAERKEDLLIFADYFLEKSNKQLTKQIIGFSDEVVDIFQKYNWPGNLREFSNVIKRAVLLTQTDVITPEVLPNEILTSLEIKQKEFSKKENEKELIIKALKETNFNKTQAARLLKITRKTLYNKLKEYSINEY